MDGMDSFQQQAVNVVLGQGEGGVRPVAKETHRRATSTARAWARSCCWPAGCARRGAGFVTLNNGYWDHHGGIIPGLKQLCPPLDQAVAAFVDDVDQRGLTDDILLVVTGEFGRTPRLNGGPGRDHWAPTNNIVFIGGGLKMGQVIGETDAKAAYVEEPARHRAGLHGDAVARARHRLDRAIRRSQRPPAFDDRRRPADGGAYITRDRISAKLAQ